ncbi:hypothetical protein RHGRI_013962 [Rhododendron griersonianum]|uniref:J domain-containing protein n=1 Tax=Rhododendron griersonianum TaxID=479676 RepID=A0AAV6K7W3_9ERIC|nr:hypothetical protein RHGRI_013962 [Rhododendron griersonianum]
MEPHSSSGNRAEADRWLLIAEKLLAGRDLVGSKTFAIRARDSDPTRLDSADQILAVADTLIAGEKRLNHDQQLDWYSILQLAGRHTADPDLVASHYRRLALLLNPQRNRLPFADHAMKLVSDAWSVLSNPTRKALYDNDIVLDNNNDDNNNNNSNYSTNEHPHSQQQDDAAVRRSSRNSNSSKTRARTVAEEIGNPSDNPSDNAGDNRSESHDVNYNFWTACPYCYNMYEYPGVYVDCSLRCQNCRRAFHGTKIMAPPPIIEGKESYFCCWGFHPLGVSISKLDKNKGGGGGGSSWSPFSPMFGGGPQFGEDRRSNVVEDGVNVGAGQMNVNAHKSSAPRIYVNDDDVYVEVSEPEEESDDDWGNNRQKKKAKGTKGKDLTGNKSVKKPVLEKAKKLKGVGDGLQGGSLMPGVMGAPNVSNAENSRKVAGNSAKKQTGKFAKQWSRLDLNVEFSNEVEEPAPGMSRLNAPGMGRGNAMGMIRGNGAGNGEEEGMEGIGFFEGLDEFLSSLPILKS